MLKITAARSSRELAATLAQKIPHTFLTSFGHVGHVDALLLGHEAQEGEDDHPGEHGGAGVHTADQQSILYKRINIFYLVQFIPPFFAVSYSFCSFIGS